MSRSKTERRREAAREAKNAELEETRKGKSDALDTHVAQKKAEAQEKTDAKLAERLVAQARKNGVNRPLTPAMKAALEASVALEAERKTAAKACLKEVLEVCEKHRCRLHAMPIMMPRNDGTFVLAANPLISNLPPQMPDENEEETPVE